MNNFTVECPNCGSSIQSENSHQLAICSYCETQVYTTVDHIFKNASTIDGKRISSLLNEVRDTIKSNNHHNTAFKDLLLKASQEKLIKAEIQDYIDSEIWNTNIKNTELINYKGDTKKFVVPFFIEKIKTKAFIEAYRLESIFISTNVKYVEDNVFRDKFLNLIIYSDTLNSTASKYAVLNHIPTEVISSKNNLKIFGGRFGELHKLVKDISRIRYRQIKNLKSHYKTMWEQRKYLIDNSNFITDYGGLDKIKNSETYDIARFNLKFLDFLNNSFKKHGTIDNFLFWNKEPNDLQNDIIILRKIVEEFKEKRLTCDFFYENYRFYNKKPPNISDYEFKKSHYSFVRFLKML